MDLFVPGRVCLFGEHTDWAGTYRRFNGELSKGYAIVVGTNQGIYARAATHPHKLIFRTRDNEGNEQRFELPMDNAELFKEAQKGGFFSYIAGVAYQVATHYRVRGVEIDNYKTDIPMKKGLSSSAAVCVLIARAFNRLYDLKMTIRGEMEYAYRGEITTPSRCGRLDQACAYGNRPVLLTFDGDQLDVKEIRVKRPLHYVIVDLMAGKDTVKILADLNRCYPFAVDELQKGVQEFLGPINERIIDQVTTSIDDGESAALGQLMYQAQEGFDRYCRPASSEQLEAPALHGLLGYVRDFPGVLGAKGVGSQGDGSAQVLVRDKKTQMNLIEALNTEKGMHAIPLDVLPPRSVRKAVIPAAGYGTRLYPATKNVRKEFLPIVDGAGICKPMILLIVEEALESGIDELALIIRPEDRGIFEDFFYHLPSTGFYEKLSRRDQEYSRKIVEIGKRITFVEQDSPEGFGHAIHCARRWVGDEPFAILLGDHVYQSRDDRRCLRQLIDTYEETGRSTVGLMPIPFAESPHYGCVSGTSVQGRYISITEFAEKPDPDYAENFLSTELAGDDHVLSIFGLYVLTPAIFSYLENSIAGNSRQNGEFQLTSSLDLLRRDEGFIGIVVDGDRYDVGQPVPYLKALEAIGPVRVME